MIIKTVRRREMKKGKKRVYAKVKRALDIFFSVALLSFLWLPMFIITMAIRIDSEGEGVFKQRRVGRGGRVFVCYKFRTMYKNAPPNIPSSQFDESNKYITRVGRFLRRSSLDELPQLLNVLKGDMSLVGPRPLIIEEETVHEGRRKSGVYELRPGITGLSQISGRDSVSDKQKIMLDTQYLDSVSLFSDIKILARTFLKLRAKETELSK